jgi:Zn-dependent protease with chaperone function
MNFFEHQETARRRTTELIFYYGLAVVLIILAIYFVVLFLFHAGQSNAAGVEAPLALWQPDLLLWVALAIGSVICFGTVYKIHALSGDGGERIAVMLGGRLLQPNTTDLAERRLLNIVEEMALASGTPVPRVFLLDHEEGINAFAAGFTPGDAVIGVTRGCVRLLTRDELQGVIAHEFSHILNGDMRLNLRLIGVLNGILVIAILGYGLFRVMANSGSGRSRSDRDKRGGFGMALLLLGLALMAIGYIGVFFGNLIKSAVSRQREFLADASSVQFTRNPPGLAGALKKIGGLVTGSRLASPRAEEASHLFFANGLQSAWLGLMATHPPLPERIQRIDPTFDGRFPEIAPGAAMNEESWAEEPPPPASPSVPPPIPAVASFAATPNTVAAEAGAPRPEHLAYAANLLAGLSSELREGLHDPTRAQAIVFALLLSPEEAVRARQIDHLTAHAGATVQDSLLRSLPEIRTAGVAIRLPLVELALPSLRRLSAGQYKAFRDQLNYLASTDGQIDLFEYAVLRMMARHLDPVFTGTKPQVIQYYSLRPVRQPCITLLATLAWSGHDEPHGAADAFAKGMGQLKGVDPVPLPGAGDSSLEELDKALDLLEATSPLVKRQIIAACTACIAADGTVTPQEGELLRAIADGLGVPLPPFVTSLS